MFIFYVVRMRIASVKSITKLTKTMQMIANNKMRSSQRKAEAAKPYAEAGLNVIEEVRVPDDGTNLLVAITSDKGITSSELFA